MTGMRCFAAIPLDEEWRERLFSACESVRACDPRWAAEKWVRPENLHITLKFFGTLGDEDVRTVIAELGATLAQASTFTLRADGVRAVPRPARATMLWGAFIDPDGSAGRLADAADAAGARVGVQPEERSFVPHATLVRARRPRPIAPEALEEAAAVLRGAAPMSVRAASLIESRLTPAGPVYTTIEEWRFTGE